MKILEKLRQVASTPYSRIRVLLALISSRFDYNTSVSTHMPIDIWTSAQNELNELVSILVEEPQYAVVEDFQIEYDDNVERVPSPSEPIIKVRGSIISYVDRLDEEFTRSLQNIDPHGTEYVDRLKDEKSLYETICRAEVHFEQSDPSSLARVMMRRLEHIYSKVGLSPALILCLLS
jgi:translation initiation factor 3 subunit C